MDEHPTPSRYRWASPRRCGPHTWADGLARGVLLLGQAVPSFWLATLLILVFAVALRWLPSSGIDDVRGLVRCPDHRHHHAHRADIERPGDEVVFAARHAHHRHDRKAAAQRELCLQGLE